MSVPPVVGKEGIWSLVSGQHRFCSGASFVAGCCFFSTPSALPSRTEKVGRSRAALKASPIHFLKKKSAVAVAALTIYDVCKAADKSMIIGDIRLVRKSGGKSGLYLAD